MAVQIDECRSNRLAARVDDPCILRVADRPRRSDSAYDAAFNHESRILDRRPTRAVNQARAFEDDRARRFLGGAHRRAEQDGKEQEKHSDDLQEISYFHDITPPNQRVFYCTRGRASRRSVRRGTDPKSNDPKSN